MKLQEKKKTLKKHQEEILMRLIKIANIVIMAIPFWTVWHFVYSKGFEDAFYQDMEFVFILIFSILYFLMGRIYEAFKISIVRVREIVYSQALSLLLADGMMYLLAWLLMKKCPVFVPAIGIFICQTVLSGVWAVLANKLYYTVHVPKKTAILYFDERDQKYLEELDTLSGKFQIEKWICVTDHAEAVLPELKGMEVVFIRGLPSDERNTVLKYCIANEIEIYQYPKLGDIIMGGAEPIHMFHVPVMRVYRFNPPVEYLFMKRVMDICVSLTGIICLSPLLLLTAAAVKCYDGGTALYKQVRLTQNGRTFEIYKFRSMRMDAEKDGIARLAQKSDSRITPVGEFIRAVRLDELPQLFNILKGDMSLVGPRPERPEIAEAYMKEMPEFALRLQVKAGLTGYAQIYGKYNTCPYDKLQMDLLYIEHPSILKDLKLIFATVKILFMKESTEGIGQGEITAGKDFEQMEKENQQIS